jgi:electron transfer flavoprotein alpha subunit
LTEVLVYVDHAGGAVRKPTLELLTLARRIGEPVAVHLGPGAETAAPVLAEHGAVKVLAADAGEFADYLIAPKVDALQAAYVAVSPAAVLVPSSAEGKEIAARLAVRIGSLHGARFKVEQCYALNRRAASNGIPRPAKAGTNY